MAVRFVHSGPGIAVFRDLQAWRFLYASRGRGVSDGGLRSSIYHRVEFQRFDIGSSLFDMLMICLIFTNIKSSSSRAPPRNGFFYFDDSDGDRVTVSVLPILRGRIFIVDGGLTDLHIFDLDEVDPVVIISGLMVDGEFVAFGVWVSFLPDPPSPADFNGNGIVGLEDFFLFAEVYGSVKGDGIYQAKFDLDQNGSIGLEDFFIFAQSFEY